MNRISYIILGVATFLINFNVYGQSNENCFLDDFEPKTAEIPPAVNAAKPSGPTVILSERFLNMYLVMPLQPGQGLMITLH
jgi:hypothetical protein